MVPGGEQALPVEKITRKKKRRGRLTIWQNNNPEETTAPRIVRGGNLKPEECKQQLGAALVRDGGLPV